MKRKRRVALLTVNYGNWLWFGSFYSFLLSINVRGNKNAQDYITGSHGKNISRGRMQMCVSRMSQNGFDGCSTKGSCAAALFTCFMDASNSDMMLFWQSCFISRLCSRSTTTVISASAAFCSVEDPWRDNRWGCWDELLVVPTLNRRRWHPVRQHRALLLFSPPSILCERLWVYLPWLFSLLSAPDRRGGSSSTWAAHWYPVEDAGGKGPLSMTASAPNTWHSVRPRCSGVWAPLSIADKPRSRLWQARSVGRRWAQMLFWPLCPPPCCLPSGVGTCSEKEKRKEYSRSLRLQHSQTLSMPMLKTSDRPRSPGSCQELTGAWPQLRKVLRSEYTMSTLFFFYV